jgi:hypothetical protein
MMQANQPQPFFAMSLKSPAEMKVENVMASALERHNFAQMTDDNSVET